MQYTYSVVRVDQDVKCIEVNFMAEGFSPILVSMPIPRLGDNIDSVIQSYAPWTIWQPQVIEYAEIAVGKSGSYVPPTPEEVEQNLKNAQMWAQVSYDKQIAEALVRLGVIQSNPTTIPVSTL